MWCWCPRRDRFGGMYVPPWSPSQSVPRCPLGNLSVLLPLQQERGEAPALPSRAGASVSSVHFGGSPSTLLPAQLKASSQPVVHTHRQSARLAQSRVTLTSNCS